MRTRIRERCQFFHEQVRIAQVQLAESIPRNSADSATEVLDASWQCFAMTFDHEKQELTGWLNGSSGDRWLDNPRNDTLISYAHMAYMQGHYASLPGKQAGEDESFPKDQYYNPPEGQR